jgi:hypothetical protein
MGVCVWTITCSQTVGVQPVLRGVLWRKRKWHKTGENYIIRISKIRTFHKILLRGMRLDKRVTCTGGKVNFYKILVTNYEGKNSFGKTKLSWENITSVKMYLKMTNSCGPYFIFYFLMLFSSIFIHSSLLSPVLVSLCISRFLLYFLRFSIIFTLLPCCSLRSVFLYFLLLPFSHFMVLDFLQP